MWIDLEQLATTEGVVVTKLLLYVTGLRLEITSLRREVAELNARLQILEPHEVV
jgi:hypothetical protein